MNPAPRQIGVVFPSSSWITENTIRFRDIAEFLG
jgi:hypothetical protein